MTGFTRTYSEYYQAPPHWIGRFFGLASLFISTFSPSIVASKNSQQRSWPAAFFVSLIVPIALYKLSNHTAMKSHRLVILLCLFPMFAFSQITVEQHPFLKWKAVASGGMTYNEVEIEPSSGSMLSNKIGPGSSYTIKVLGPKGFQAVEGNAYFGIGVSVVSEQNPSENVSVDDIYEGQDTGVGVEMIKSLSLEFTPGENYKAGEIYVVTTVFFDREGTGKIEITIPFVVAAEADVSNNVENFANWQSSANVGVLGQSVDPGNSAFQLNGQPLGTLFVKSTDKLAFAADLSGMPGAKICYWAITDYNGMSIDGGELAQGAGWNGVWAFDLTKVTGKKPVLVTYSVEGNNGRIGFSEWFYYLGTEQRQAGDQAIFSDLLIKAGVQKSRAGLGREALLVLENAASHGTGSNGLLYSLGYAYNEIGEYTLATDNLNKLIGKDPNNFSGWFELGYAHKQLANYHTSLAAYLKCVSLDPDHYFSNYHVGWTLIELGRYEESLPYLEKAIAVNPANYKQPYDERIYANKKLGNLKAVIDDMVALAQLNPYGGGEYYYNIGYNKIEVGDYEGAVEYLTKAFEEYPDKYDAVYERGYAYKMMGSYALALEDFNTTISLAEGEEPANTYLHRGDCYAALGDKTKACEDFSKASATGVALANDRLKEHCGR